MVVRDDSDPNNRAQSLKIYWFAVQDSIIDLPRYEYDS